MPGEGNPCPECLMVGMHKMQCSRRPGGFQVKLPVKIADQEISCSDHNFGERRFSIRLMSKPNFWVVVRFRVEVMHPDMGRLIGWLGEDHGAKKPMTAVDDGIQCMHFLFESDYDEVGQFVLETWQALNQNVPTGEIHFDLTRFRENRK